jgi:hypothetical protein
MNVLSNELYDFAVAYIERSTGKKVRKGRDLFAYIRDLDSESFKKLSTACRVAKKRQLDAESGNKAVNVTLTKKAHETLLRMAGGTGISNYIESLESKALERNEWLDMANGSTKAWRLKAESLQAEIDTLQLKLRNAMNVARDLANKVEPIEVLGETTFVQACDTVTPKVYQNDKPIDTVKRCQALTTKGTRCKATDNLDSDGKTVLCKFHMGILRRTHANDFKLFDGRKI